MRADGRKPYAQANVGLLKWGSAMNCPFPGNDPYLEHPVLWEGVHARLMVAIANQLQPKLDPRYVTSIEERVFIEGPQRRIPDVWIQKVREEGGVTPSPTRNPIPRSSWRSRTWRFTRRGWRFSMPITR